MGNIYSNAVNSYVMESLDITYTDIQKFISNINSKKDIKDTLTAQTDICYYLNPILFFLPVVIVKIINEYYEKKYTLEYQTQYIEWNYGSMFNIYFLSLCNYDKKYILSIHLQYFLFNDREGTYEYRVYGNYKKNNKFNEYNKYLVKKYDITVVHNKKKIPEISGSLYGPNFNFKSIYLTNIKNITQDLVKILNILLENYINTNYYYIITF